MISVKEDFLKSDGDKIEILFDEGNQWIYIKYNNGSIKYSNFRRKL